MTNSAADVTRRGLVIGECSGRFGLYGHQVQKKAEKYATLADVNGVFKLLRKYDVSARKLVNPSTSAAALEAIRSTFAGADDNDVSYLYIGAHGGVNSSDVFYMAIGSGGYTNNDIYLYVTQLKSELDKVPGTKVIFLESCHSGSVIGKGVKGGLQAAEAFRTTDAFVKAFKGSAAPKAGELAANGYCVLCSVSGTEYAWLCWNSRLLGYKRFTGGLFTHGLTKGAGWDMMRKKNVSAAADTNKDKVLAFDELYTYAHDTVEAAKAEFRNRYNVHDMYQVVQCYPDNHPYPIFTIK